MAVEAPCYDRMVTLLRAVGAQAASVARTPAGLDLDRIRDLFAGRSRPSFLYVLPTFHNPTGLTLTFQQREQLADLAVDLEIPVLEDDLYGLLRLDGEPLPHLHTLLRRRGADRLAIYLSSFSKTLSPGLRVGYTIGPEALIARLRDRAVAAYVSPPMLAQAELYEFLDGGHLQKQLERVRACLRPRRDALLATFDERMPPDARWTRPEGGYFVWLELPPQLHAQTFAERAAAAGVSIVPGPAFFAAAGGEQAARLSFSFPTVEQIRAGRRGSPSWPGADGRWPLPGRRRPARARTSSLLDRCHGERRPDGVRALAAEHPALGQGGDPLIGVAADARQAFVRLLAAARAGTTGRRSSATRTAEAMVRTVPNRSCGASTTSSRATA